jgi:hypothetical protein
MIPPTRSEMSNIKYPCINQRKELVVMRINETKDKSFTFFVVNVLYN